MKNIVLNGISEHYSHIQERQKEVEHIWLLAHLSPCEDHDLLLELISKLKQDKEVIRNSLIIFGNQLTGYWLVIGMTGWKSMIFNKASNTRALIWKLWMYELDD